MSNCLEVLPAVSSSTTSSEMLAVCNRRDTRVFCVKKGAVTEKIERFDTAALRVMDGTEPPILGCLPHDAFLSLYISGRYKYGSKFKLSNSATCLLLSQTFDWCP